MVKALDITGDKYHDLTAIKRLANGQWEFKCDCGNTVALNPKVVRCGNTKSCGCLKAQLLLERNRTHSKSDTKLYARYQGMIARCTNPKHASYANYGGRGIQVCKRWVDSFDNFLADMGEPKSGESIDRIDPNGDYSPENCRWASSETQSRNTRRNVLVEVGSIIKTVRDWEIHNGVKRGTYQRRVDLGWDLKEAVTQPIMPGKSFRSRK